MIEAGSRTRHQAPPPRILFDALTEPNRDPARPWLLLLDDEQPPRILQSEAPTLVMWSSLWTKRPDAVIRFDLPASPSKPGTDLRWTLLVDEPLADAALLGHLRKRLNRLINEGLRMTFGQ